MAQQAFTDYFKSFGDYQAPSFDFSAFSTIGQRNAEAFSSAAQQMAESAQAISRRNVEIFREGLEQTLAATREIFSGQSPEMNISRQTEFAKGRLESTLANLREISDLATKSSFETAQLLQQRLNDSFSEMQDAALPRK
jgi:phasin family protein